MIFNKIGNLESEIIKPTGDMCCVLLQNFVPTLVQRPTSSVCLGEWRIALVISVYSNEGVYSSHRNTKMAGVQMDK